MWEESQSCDLILKSEDGVKMKVHKVTAALVTGFFSGMLTHGLKECGQKCVELKRINSDSLQKIVSFMYSGEIDLKKFEEYEEISKHAAVFQLSQLEEDCSSHLKNYIEEEYCLELLDFSEINLTKCLQRHSLEYILKNANDLLKKEDILRNLTTDQLKKILDDDRLPCTQEFVLKTVINWAEIDKGF